MDNVSLVKQECKEILDSLRHMLRYLPEKIHNSVEYKDELRKIHSLVSKLETNFVFLQGVAEKSNAR